VDLSVLDQLGQPAAGQSVSPQLASIAANTYPSQGAGELLYPPIGNPVSMLTVPPPPTLSPVVAALPQATSLASAGEALETKSNSATASTAEEPAVPATDLAASAGASTDGASTGSESMPAVPPMPPAPGTQASASTDTGTGATAASGDAQPATTAAANSGTIAPAPTAESSASGTTAPAGNGSTNGEATIASIGTQPTDSGGATVSSDGGLHIVFPKDSADIPDAAKSELDSLAQKLTADEKLRIELFAYASGTADTANAARRTSLLRALAVRSYLVKHGVDGTRMDVRALGNKVEGTPADRVDLLPSSS
jgi:outer membrane protein OmpA-like peptidoglycan-associated protein